MAPRHQSWLNLPDFNMARGAASLTLQAESPGEFTGTTARIFPLKASMNQLCLFCDQYLNIIPPEIGYFRPALPYVMMEVLDYQKLAGGAHNLGWFGYKEITFNIPLAWYRQEGNQLVFQDWVYLIPFLFLDSNLGISTGRSEYGWMKVEGTFEPTLNPWLNNPRLPRRLLSFHTRLLPSMYTGDSPESRLLISIDQDAPVLSSQFPVGIQRSWDLIAKLPQAIAEGGALLSDMLPRLPGLRELASLNARDAVTMLRRGLTTLSLTAAADVKAVTLLQFRDAAKPEFACYQAVLIVPLRVKQLNDWGMLGDYNLLQADPAGGFRVSIHRYASQPLVELLGLEVEEQVEIEGQIVDRLRPVFPFWLGMDLATEESPSLGWRSIHSPDWRSEEAGSTRVWPGARSDRAGRKQAAQELPEYNTARAGAVQAVPGPYWFPDARLDVFPLLADSRRLRRFCAEYLDNPFYRFEPFGTYVYALVTDFGRMASETNNIGSWAEQEVRFSIPLKWYRLGEGATVSDVELGQDVARQIVQELDAERCSEQLRQVLTDHQLELPAEVSVSVVGEQREWSLQAKAETGPRYAIIRQQTGLCIRPTTLISLGLVSPFIYTNSDISAVSAREINGLPAVQAVLESPRQAWMAVGKEADNKSLLSVQTEVFPALQAGAQLLNRVVVAIDQTADLDDPGISWPAVEANWGSQLVEDMQSKKSLRVQSEKFLELKALALELLLHKNPFNEITLKQFREVNQPSKAVYQAIVCIPRTIEAVHEIQEIAEPIHVRIYHYATQPIIDTLGLRVKRRDVNGEAERKTLQPIRPFSIRVALRQDLGKPLCWRVRSQAWQSEPGSLSQPGYFEQPHRTKVGPGLLTYMNTTRFNTRHLAEAGQHWLDMGDEEDCLTMDEAKAAIETIGEPHVVIESILSDEWMQPVSADDCPSVYEKQDFLMRRDSVGPPDAESVEKFAYRNGLIPFDQTYWCLEPPRRRLRRVTGLT